MSELLSFITSLEGRNDSGTFSAKPISDSSYTVVVIRFFI